MYIYFPNQLLVGIAQVKTIMRERLVKFRDMVKKNVHAVAKLARPRMTPALVQTSHRAWASSRPPQSMDTSDDVIGIGGGGSKWRV